MGLEFDPRSLRLLSFDSSYYCMRNLKWKAFECHIFNIISFLLFHNREKIPMMFPEYVDFFKVGICLSFVVFDYPKLLLCHLGRAQPIYVKYVPIVQVIILVQLFKHF